MSRHVIPPLFCPKYSTKSGARRKTGQQAQKLVGYYTQGARPNYARLTEYHKWKDHVRESVTAELPSATKDAPVRLDVWCYFPSGTHADPENVRKGIVDALFPGGDKYVYGYHHHPLYDAVNPRVEIEVTQ